MSFKRALSFVIFLSFISAHIAPAQSLSDGPPRVDPKLKKYSLGNDWRVGNENGLGDFIAGYYPGAVMIPVNLWGATKTSGLFRVPKNTTLTTLLSYARGPTEDAELDEVKIKRVSGSKEQVFKVDVEKIFDNPAENDVILQPNDIVYVVPKKTYIDPRLVYLVAFIASIASIGVAGVTIYDRSR
ncbi:MAG: SLBB domain-containing protein [Bdellovibrionota bacterium]